MKKTIIRLLALTLTACLGVASAATITVTTEAATGPGSLTAAINALNHGDTIAFNIPGAGVHYIQTPADGYPLITRNNVTIDGYTQPGSSVNTASIHAANNAQLRICLTSTNGNALSMETAINTSWGSPIPRVGYGDDEQAILGFFHATNATIKGLAILSAPLTGTTITPGTCKSICFAANSAENGGGQCQNWRISGCWFGVDPTTRQVAFMPDGFTVATPGIAIASYRTRNAVAPDNTVYNTPGTIGVSAGSANPRAEFNVIVTGYGFDAEGLDYRFSGNFWGVLPDGMTSADMSELNSGAQLGDGFIEVGRSVNNCIVGTDGDGVNDADEGNVFGGMANGGANYINFYSSPHTNLVIAGNWFNYAVDGVTRFTNSARLLDTFANTATVQFGSDLNGVSDALEGNRICNITNASNIFINGTGGSINPGARVSFRGNSTVNNELLPYSYANGFGSRLINFTNYSLPYMDPATSIIPTLDPTSTSRHLKGTFALGTNSYTNIIIDVYQLDREGWDYGKLLAFIELTDNGFAQGSKYLGSRVVPNTGSFDINVSDMDFGGAQVTVTANYSRDPAGTTRGRVHTSDFSMPINLAFVPGSAESVGLTRLAPDTVVWSHSQNFVGGGITRIGGYVAGEQATEGTSVEGTVGLLGDSTFLLAAITRATNDDANMSFASVLIPATGGTPKLDNVFYTDAGTKWLKKINLSRQTGNPGRIGGDPRYGAVNYGGAGEVSLFAYPEFNSDGRWSNPFFADALARDCRSYGGQLHRLDPYTLASTPLMKAVDPMFGRLWTNSVATIGGQDFGRTGSSPIGLDNGNFVFVGEDRTGFFNSGGNRRAAVATIFAPNGSIVKEAFSVTPDGGGDGSMWNSVGSFRGGFFVRPAGGVIYFYDNAGNLQGTNNHNATSGLIYDNGRSDGTRMCSDIRSRYVFQAGKSPESGSFTNIMLTAYDANTRLWITNTIVSTEGNQDLTSLGATRLLDRCNLACDAYNRVVVAYRLKPDRVAFTQEQIAARVFSFDGTKFTPLTPTFFPFIEHDADPNSLAGFKSIEPSVVMTPREILFYAKGMWNGTANPTNAVATLDNTHCYTILRHPAPIAAPRPAVTITKSGANLNLAWNPDDGLFTVQTRASATSGTWVNATAGNVAPPVTIPAGAGPLYVRLAR